MSVNLLGDKRYFTTRNIWRSKPQKYWWSQVTITPSIFISWASKNKVSLLYLSFDCFNWFWEQVLRLSWVLILNSFPICPQSLLSLICDDISSSELCKGQISIKIVCRIFKILQNSSDEYHFRYRWEKNGKPFSWQVYDDRISEQPGRGTLVISSPRTEDIGELRIRVLWFITHRSETMLNQAFICLVV